MIDRLAMITYEEYPIIFLDIDGQNPVDITAREGDEEAGEDVGRR